MIRRFEREERKEGKRPPSTPRRRKPPEELAYLLDWYDHCRGGQARGQEAEPLSHQEILAFNHLHRLRMSSFEVQILRRLDGPWFKALPKHHAENDNARPQVGRS